MKVLNSKVNRESGMMSEADVNKFVKARSKRYQTLYAMMAKSDLDFYKSYQGFMENHLPVPVVNFSDEKCPQITANMFRIVEQRECHNLQIAMKDRYEELRDKKGFGRNIIVKERKGKNIIKNM